MGLFKTISKSFPAFPDRFGTAPEASGSSLSPYPGLPGKITQSLTKEGAMVPEEYGSIRQLSASGSPTGPSREEAL